MNHLRPKQEYIDRYDRITVEDCRRRENFHKDYKFPDEDKDTFPHSAAEILHGVASHYSLFGATLSWWEDKDKTINEWMEADRRRDEMLAAAHAPEGIRCLKCRAVLTPGSGSIHDFEGKELVLFFYTCHNKCLPLRAIFDNGEEYKSKPHLCPKCQTKLEEKDERKGKKIQSISTCPNCEYIDTYEFDLETQAEIPDPDYVKDRERFCLTNEQGKKAIDERFQMEQISKFVDEWKKKDEQKEDYELMSKIQQLTVIELEKLLAPLLEKAAYIRLQIGVPEITKDIFLPFTIYDSKSGRNAIESSYDLKRIIKKTLAHTNWRLMSDGISCRLGVLTGRLRAYEREEDLLSLVRQKGPTG